jgi:hypothetical protein
MQLTVRLGLVLALGLASFPGAVFAQDPQPPTSDGLPIGKGTAVFVVTGVKKHEGVMPLDATPNSAPTLLIGKVTGDRGSGFKLLLTGGPVIAGAPRNYALRADGANLDALAAAASVGYVVDVTGTVELPKATLPIFAVTSVQKHEGLVPLAEAASSTATAPTHLLGRVSGDKEKGFRLDLVGGPIGVQQQRAFSLKADGSVLDDLAAAVTGAYLVDVNGQVQEPTGNSITLTGDVSEDGSKITRAGGPIRKGEHRVFALSVPADRSDLTKALADARTGHYLVTVTGTLLDSAITVTGVTKFTGLLPQIDGAPAKPTGEVKTGGLVNSPGLDQPPKR